ncbi:hypothetical protein RZS08_01730, partial [Arthrospira platensis SPKY1]|nr:hypothetical protein [Arthrospira platensis SPKY1]
EERSNALVNANYVENIGDYQTVPRSSTMGKQVLLILEATLAILKAHPDASPGFILVLIAVYCRKITLQRDICEFFYPKNQMPHTLAIRSIRRLEAAGYLHCAPLGACRKAGILIRGTR